MKENNVLKMYDLVFEDCVKCYLEDMEDKVNLSDSEIHDIAHRLIYKSEYMWEIINETIDYEIGKILEKRF